MADPKFLKFPERFLWGSATSSHQIEGHNQNDWSEWERSSGRIKQLKGEGKDPDYFISGQACDSFNRYQEDFDIAGKLNHNIHRFSIEWSRIEPEEGKFDSNAMRHYIDVVKSIQDRGMEPMITLWHFSNPLWFARQGGFLSNKSPEQYKRFIRHVVDNLKDRVGLWITFNEAISVYGGLAYLKGRWPPQHKSWYDFWKFKRNIIKAHTLAYREIKNIYRKWPAEDVSLTNDYTLTSHNIRPMVGIAENIPYVIGGKLMQKLGGIEIIRKLINDYVFSKTLPYQDFIGLNYYTIKRLSGSDDVLAKQAYIPEMGWEIYPEGIYHQLMHLKKYNKPIFITENGISNAQDNRRAKFIRDHLYWIWRAIQDGVDLRGYLYWSLLDNFEWAKGFEPRFGLVEVDYQTFERKIRPSALEYAKIIQNNGFDYSI